MRAPLMRQRGTVRTPSAKRKLFVCGSVVCLAIAGVFPARAQLVADGATNILDGVITNLANLTIGTNGSFTLLVLTNGARVTNTSLTTIGANASAQSNRVIVIGSGSFLGSTNLLGDVYVGHGGSFNGLSILGGAVVANKSGVLGLNEISTSNAVTVAGSGSLWTQAGLYIGYAGGGNRLLITDGGTVKSGTGAIGYGSSGSNLVIVTGSGSVWSNSAVYVGNDGHRNTLIVTNRGRVTGGGDCIGRLSGSAGNTAIVTGLGSLWQNANLYIGSAGAGPSNRLVINAGGAVLSSSFCTIGFFCNSNSVLVTGLGSRFTNSDPTVVGYASQANELVVSNGAVMATGATLISENGGSRNRVTVTGAGSLMTNGADFYIGQVGSSNELVLADGGTVANKVGFVGYEASARANRALVTGPWTVWTNGSNLYVGYNGPANQLIVSNGASVFDQIGYVGYLTPGTNSAIVTGAGSLWANRSGLYVGYFGSDSQLVISNGGTVIVAGTLTLSYGARTNMITISGGNLIVTNNSQSAQTEGFLRGTITLNSGTFRSDVMSMTGGRLVLNGGTLQTRSGNLGSLVVGDGSSPATYEMLLPGGTHYVTGFVVSSNAVLKGGGTINGNVSIADGGLISPGTSNLGAVNISGNLTLSNATSAYMKLNPVSGSADQIAVSGGVTFGGTLQVTNVNGVFGAGNAFPLFTAGSFAGGFTNISPASPGPDLKWNLNGLNTDGILRIVAIPTPPPILSDAAIADGNLTISATDGIAYDPCVLLTSTNVAEPVVSWTPCATNLFNGSGNVVFTNALPLDELQRYFRLQVQ